MTVVGNSLAHAFRQIAADYQIKAKVEVYRKDPVLWARERLGMDMWSVQRSVAVSVEANKKTAVKSCHAIGKTLLAAIIACWWIDTHPPEETMVVSTAPTAAQVNKLLWEYIRKIHRAHNLSGTVTETAEWKSEDRDTIGIGRKPADTNIHGFQGVHRTYVLVIIDEAGGVAQSLWTGAEAITTSPTNRIFAVGNPDDAASEFGRIFLHDDPSWAKFTVSAFDTPNFTGEADNLPAAVSENLIEPVWVEEKRLSWGEGSARWMSKILAEFPTNSDENLFPVSLLLSSQDNTIIPKQAARGVLGVDVARFGKDKTTVILNLDGLIQVVGSWEKTDTVETASKVHSLATKLGVDQVRVDATGVGAGVVDQLIHIEQAQYLVVSMVGSERSPDIRKWRNARAWWFDSMREKMVEGKISLPTYTNGQEDADSKLLFEELEGLRYKFASAQGSILIESKDEMRARGQKSPDYADALAYACADFDVNDPMAGYSPGDVVSVNPLSLTQWSELGFVVSPL